MATNRISHIMLPVSPLSKKTKLDADERVDFVSSMLNLVEKCVSKVTSFNDDKNAVDKRKSNLRMTHLLDCASHRFNLAMKVNKKKN